MRAIKVFFFFITIIIIAGYIGGGVLAAEVIKVKVSKGHVYIDAGKKAGFIMGADVCFYSFEGEEIDCGKVRRTSDVGAMVEVNNRKAKLIKKKMPARLSVKEKD